MWSTQWTMLRSIAGLLARLGHGRDAAVLLGPIHATQAGHRVFGADEVALRELGRRLPETLGSDAYEAALAEGAVLDGNAAVEHALRALVIVPEPASSTNASARGTRPACGARTTRGRHRATVPQARGSPHDASSQLARLTGELVAEGGHDADLAGGRRRDSVWHEAAEQDR
jgi:hypothetical protein